MAVDEIKKELVRMTAIARLVMEKRRILRSPAVNGPQFEKRLREIDLELDALGPASYSRPVGPETTAVH